MLHNGVEIKEPGSPEPVVSNWRTKMTKNENRMAKMMFMQNVIDTVIQPALDRMNEVHKSKMGCVIAGGICRDWFFANDGLELKGTSGDLDVHVYGIPDGVDMLLTVARQLRRVYNVHSLTCNTTDAIVFHDDIDSEYACETPGRITDVLQYTHTIDTLDEVESTSGFDNLDVDIIFMESEYTEAVQVVKSFESPINMFLFNQDTIINVGYSLKAADDYEVVGSVQEGRRKKMMELYKQVANHYGVTLVDCYGMTCKLKGPVMSAVIVQKGILITFKDMMTNKCTTKVMPIAYVQDFEWLSGTLIQRAMPHLSADDRELLLTGMTF